MLYNRSSKKTTQAILLFTCFTMASTVLLHAMEQDKYLPVILVSGISADQNGMAPMIKMIQEHMPGVYVRHVEIGMGEITSFWNMFDQAEDLAKALYQDPNLHNGFNIVAHSQGGLVARFFIERFNCPPVCNYIALGSPQRGINGIPSDIDHKYIWLKIIEEYFSTPLYTYLFQEFLSFAGYWNDSMHHEEYLNECTFLPYLNNEKKHAHARLFKENLCKLHNMVLVQSTKEYIVEPAISCHFGFYKEGSMTQEEHMLESAIYRNDTLGLRTLNLGGRLHLREAHCLHTHYESDVENFKQNVLPFLILNTQGKNHVG